MSTASEVGQEELDDALWLVETSQGDGYSNPGYVCHGPFDNRAAAAAWASEVLQNRSMLASRTVRVRPLFRPSL